MTGLLWWHRAGQKVVCVQDFDFLCRAIVGGVVPEIDQTYTIRDAHVVGDLVGLYFEEIVSRRLLGVEVDFGSTHFRPVRETSIECLRALLNPPPNAKCDDLVEEDAHA